MKSVERDAILEEAAKACEEQQRIFASSKYAAGQPMSSFGERFAAGRCAEAIRALKATPAPAEDDDPDDHSGSKLAAAVERELDRIEQRNSTRQDFTPAFDRELARKVIMAGFGLFSCRGGTTASGYQWSGLLETLGLNKARPVSTAPAVSRDDQALFNDICAKMEEVVAPLPGIPDAPGQHAGTRAIEPSDGDEA